MSSPESSSSKSSSKSSRSAWQARAIIGAATILVLLPLLVYGTSNEVAKWQLAVAQKKYKDGNRQDAIEDLTKVAQKIPRDVAAQKLLSQWLAENGKIEQAVTNINELIAQVPDQTEPKQIKLDLLQRQGKHAEAADLYETLTAEMEITDSAVAMEHFNNLAYYRALGGRRLGSASQNIGKTLDQLENQISLLLNVNLDASDALIICSLLLPHSQEQLEQGLKLLDRHIDQRTEDVWTSRLALTQGGSSMIQGELPLDSAKRQKLIELRKDNQRMTESLAMLVTLRAFLHQQQGDEELSMRDRQYVLGLGYDPRQLLEKMPSTRHSILISQHATSYLDTRGYLNYRKKKIKQAQADLDDAVFGSEVFYYAITNDNSSQEMIQIIRSMNPTAQPDTLEKLKKSLAVILYHRMLAQKKSNPAAANRDAEKIKNLGFEASDKLF